MAFINFQKTGKNKIFIGPNMIAICFPNRTIYDCNLFQKGPNMTAIVEKYFSRDSSRNHTHVTSR